MTLDEALKMFNLSKDEVTDENRKKVYKKLAQKYHPDAHPEEDTKEQFQLVNAANEEIIKYLKNKENSKEQVYHAKSAESFTSAASQKKYATNYFEIRVFENSLRNTLFGSFDASKPENIEKLESFYSKDFKSVLYDLNADILLFVLNARQEENLENLEKDLKTKIQKIYKKFLLKYSESYGIHVSVTNFPEDYFEKSLSFFEIYRRLESLRKNKKIEDVIETWRQEYLGFDINDTEVSQDPYLKRVSNSIFDPIFFKFRMYAPQKMEENDFNNDFLNEYIKQLEKGKIDFVYGYFTYYGLLTSKKIDYNEVLEDIMQNHLNLYDTFNYLEELREQIKGKKVGIFK